MDESEQPQTHGRPFGQKLRCALRGAALALRTESNFRIHLAAAAGVVAVAAAVHCSALEWAALVVCIAVVLAAEVFNSAIEQLARAVTREQNPQVRDALDIASGAVLVASVGAAVAGFLVLGLKLLAAAGWSI